jgi:hypothetical protein
MNPRLGHPLVTQELFDEVVRRTLSAGTPLRIVLFGSLAKKQSRQGIS